MIAFPKFFTVMGNAQNEVCEANRIELEHAYEIYLVQNDKTDSDTNFNMFLNQYNQKICPESGIISRVNGEIHFSIHTDNVDETKDTEENSDEVPFL